MRIFLDEILNVTDVVKECLSVSVRAIENSFGFGPKKGQEGLIYHNIVTEFHSTL